MKSANLSQFFQMRLNVFLFKLLPPSLSYFYLCSIGRLYYLVNRKEKAEIYRNVTEVFNHRCGSRERKRIAKGVFKGIFTHYFEKLFLAYYDLEKLKAFLLQRVEIHGLSKIQESLREGRGAILVTGHFGGVEFLPGTLALHNCKLNMMVRCQTPTLKRILHQRARSVQLSIIDCDTQSSNLFYAGLDCLKRNEVLITECDEVDKWSPSKGRTIDLLGHKLILDRSLELLQRRSRAPVLTVFVRRLKGRRYVLEINALDDFVETQEAPSISSKLLKILERFVYLHPEQWYQWKQFQRMKWTPAY